MRKACGRRRAAVAWGGWCLLGWLAAAPAAYLGEAVNSAKPRERAPKVSKAESAALVTGATRCALSLYHRQGAERNLVYSPHSVSLALAMAYAGARGATATQMAKVLGFTLPSERLHPALNAQALELAKRESSAETGEAPFRLRIVNALWGQQGLTFLAPFLDLLAVNHGAGMRVVDFAADPEAARRAVNAWVAAQTAERIKDLLGPGALTPQTSLVLTNAVYFQAAWQEPFKARDTKPGSFTCLDGERVRVPFMHQTESLPYAAGEGWQAVEVPYAGRQLALLLVVPERGRFAKQDTELDAGKLRAITGALRSNAVALSLPKFRLGSDLALGKTLQAMGMTDAFDSKQADFGGLCGTQKLFLTRVQHKAYISVDEQGTEAAAATAAIGETASAPKAKAGPVLLTIDRPFILVLRDRPTGTVLFLGRVVNPAP